MEPKRPRKLELLASRIEPRLWQYELNIAGIKGCKPRTVLFSPRLGWCRCVIAGRRTYSGYHLFFPVVFTPARRSGWNSGIHKYFILPRWRLGVLGGVFRVLYMQSDLLFLSISLALSVLASLTVSLPHAGEGRAACICKPDLARMVLCLIAGSVLLLWHPPLPITDINLFPAEELLQ